MIVLRAKVGQCRVILLKAGHPKRVVGLQSFLGSRFLGRWGTIEPASHARAPSLEALLLTARVCPLGRPLPAASAHDKPLPRRRLERRALRTLACQDGQLDCPVRTVLQPSARSNCSSAVPRARQRLARCIATRSTLARVPDVFLAVSPTRALAKGLGPTGRCRARLRGACW